MATLTELVDLDSGVASSDATPEAATVEEVKGTEVATLVKEEEEEDDDDLDESLGERLWGLVEMFPDGLRSGCINAVSSTANLAKSVYGLSRQVVWVAVSSSILLFAPVMFELERLNVEEMMKQDRNRLVLGPGSAMSGPPPPGAPGLMPSPPAR